MRFSAMGVGGLLAVAAMAASASADTLYDNGAIRGANAYGFGPWSGGPCFVSNSFVLSTNSTVTGVNLGLWANAGESPKTLDWAISTTDADWTGQNAVASGTAASLSNTFWGIQSFDGSYIYQSSFATGSVTLNAGTYYLMLHNGTDNLGNMVYWDASHGASTGTQRYGSNVQPVDFSESFSINGTVAVPEPASLSLLGVGALVLIRRQRSQG